MNSVITYIKENKIKTLLGICAISSIIYYGKKNYTKIKNFYEQIFSLFLRIFPRLENLFKSKCRVL